ncbi:hypothetical protein GCM10009574_094860 [Streptomyces asiaticus]|uniref:Peptidase M48 domain-containing protein n=2 Tax=Streptomyces rhizosphaericus TaxID=114699 RepID=A0ABN1QUW6_9ACTN
MLGLLRLNPIASVADLSPGSLDQHASLAPWTAPVPMALLIAGLDVVVSSAMLRTLHPGEREALFAHERAHLSGQHRRFLAAGRLTPMPHPALRGLGARGRVLVSWRLSWAGRISRRGCGR